MSSKPYRNPDAPSSQPGYFARIKRLKRYGREVNTIFESATSCDLCGRKGAKLVIDHNHVTGEYRGILCYKCNVGIGLFNEDRELFLKAITYVEGNE